VSLDNTFLQALPIIKKHYLLMKNTYADELEKLYLLMKNRQHLFEQTLSIDELKKHFL